MGFLLGLDGLEELDALGDDFFEILIVFVVIRRRHGGEEAEIRGGFLEVRVEM